MHPSARTSCRHQRRCTGCPRIALSYEEQLRQKADSVGRHLAAALTPKGSGSYAELRQTVPSPLPFGYRTSAKLCLNEEATGRKSIGLYRRGSKTVIDIPQCPVQHAEINRILATLFAKGRALPAPLYDHRKRYQSGKLKFLTLRFCPATQEAGLVVSHTGVERRKMSAWIKALDKAKISVFESFVAPEDADLVMGRQINHLTGKQSFDFSVMGVTFALPPTAFFQANFALTDLFVEHIIDFSDAHTHQILLDLYGGFGAYALAARRSFSKIVIVDGNEAAIQAGQAAIAEQKFEHIEAIAVYVESFLESLLNAPHAASVTHAIVNPPRAGISAKVRSQLSSAKLKSLRALTYVSCNPETLGRDLIHLKKTAGFKIASVTPFDMFPQTDHIEVVAKLTR